MARNRPNSIVLPAFAITRAFSIIKRDKYWPGPLKSEVHG
jgi:hypothetical protein